MIQNELTKKHIIEVKNGLITLDKVFNKQSVDYRVLGSVLVAALNGKPHRTLGDIDVLVDEQDYKKVTSGLQKEGYKLETRQKYGFKWIEAQKSGSLGFTFLLIGKFLDAYFSYKLAKKIELKISANYLKPTKYSLFGVNFIGIPTRSVHEGLKISNLNPKRSLDRPVVLKSFQQIPEGDSLDQSFKILIRNVEIPHAYAVFSQLYNLYGGLRVLFGKRYEVWG